MQDRIDRDCDGFVVGYVSRVETRRVIASGLLQVKTGQSDIYAYGFLQRDRERETITFSGRALGNYSRKGYKHTPDYSSVGGPVGLGTGVIDIDEKLTEFRYLENIHLPILMNKGVSEQAWPRDLFK